MKVQRIILKFKNLRLCTKILITYFKYVHTHYPICARSNILAFYKMP